MTTPELEATESSLETLPVHSMVGEFEILGIIGEGGFGTVYLAMDHALERQVALKEYRPGALATRTGTTIVVRSQRHSEAFAAGLKSFINEARTLARFDHPALVRVYRFWQDNGTAYMAMPLYSGQTLTQYVRDRRDHVDEAWLKHIVAPLLDAIEALHGAHIYHRDIAPDNVLIQENGMPILLDFGAARQIIADMTQALTVILKPGYAPVEQYAEDESMKQGPWTDIYALGAILHFAVTGRAPMNSVTRIVNDTQVPLVRLQPAGYTPQFLSAVDCALAVRPEGRPQSIAALRALFGFPSQVTATTRDDGARKPDATSSVPPTTTKARSAGIAGTAQPDGAASSRRSRATKAKPTTIMPPAREPVPAKARQPASPPAAVKPPAATKPATAAKPSVATPLPAGATDAMPLPADAVTDATRKRPMWPWIAAGGAGILAVVVAIRMQGLAPSVSSPETVRAVVEQPKPGSADVAGAPGAGGPAPAAAPAIPAPAAPAATVTQSPAQSAAGPGAAQPGTGSPPSGADAATATTPAGETTAAAGPPQPVTGQGTVRFDVKPWAALRVDGEDKGVTPPVKSLKLGVGKHVIELSNPNFPAYTADVEVEKDKRVALSYQFK